MHKCQAGGFFLVLLEDEEGGVGAVRGEGGDFADGVFVRMVVGGTWDIDAVGEEGGEEVGLGVEIGVEGGRDESFGSGRWR